MQKNGLINKNPLKEFVAAISVGIVNGKPVLDLDYEQDSKADVDMNIVMMESGKFVEIQGTAESNLFSDEELTELIHLAKEGIKQLINEQKNTDSHTE